MSDSDDLKELKEAVCDAVLERTRRVVSGEGEHGRVVLGEKPSRVLSSGFLLPRLNVGGDDESSDIRIAAHGLDVRLLARHEGNVEVQPSLSIYVRALPSAEELFARNGRLVPAAEFSGPAKQHLRDLIKARLRQGTDAITRAERLEARENAARQAMEEMGVVIPQGSAIRVDDESPADEQPLVQADIRTRLQIPDQWSRTYQVPQKWIRVDVAAAPLRLPAPCNPNSWRAAAQAYRKTLCDALAVAGRSWVESAEGEMWAWRPIEVLSHEFWSPAAWEAFLIRARSRPVDVSRLVPRFDVELLVDALEDVLRPDVLSVRIAIENVREHDDDLECGIFGVSVTVELPNEMLLPMYLERVERSYHLAGFLSMPAVGVNGGVDDRGTAGGRRRLRTTWMPRYVLPRTRPAEIANLPTEYAELARETLDLVALRGLPTEMERWIVQVEQQTRLSTADDGGSPEDDAAQKVRFRSDVEAWRREAARVRKGIDLLLSAQRANPTSEAGIPYRAWLLLNQTLRDANPSRPDNERPGWRLFQLAFVLAHVPTLASRLTAYSPEFDEEFDEDSASLLYMTTGGGKTEAFFGTIVYALFLDRLRGKRRGVTAMMHYPLRLLTIQQAQRLARLLARAELIRRRHQLAGAPFEIGFWVGSSNTPNRTEQGNGVAPALRAIPTWRDVPVSAEARLLDPAYVAARDAWNKLPECPFCGAVTGLRLFPERHHRLGIVCTAPSACPWVLAQSSGTVPEPLPFLLVDSDIYRRAPAVLLGTVDKLALIGQNTYTINRIAAMFGMAHAVEGGSDGLLMSLDGDADTLPPNAERVAPASRHGVELFLDPFPSLIVQDEMHLLDESLGTFGGIFETGLFAWLRELAAILDKRVSQVPSRPHQPRLPHVVGATATAADAAKHVSALYQKRVIQFPHPGPSLHGGFYVRLDAFKAGSDAYAARTSMAEDANDREAEACAPWARVYASIMTNGRLHTVTTLSVLATHAATITRWLRDLGSGNPSRQEQAAREIYDNISDARWSDRRRASVARAASAGQYHTLATLVDLHRIELTYVTNKKGGDPILSALQTTVTDFHEAMGRDYYLSDFKMELISGGVDVKGIQAVIRRAQAGFDPFREDVADALRGIVATSAISHGVDVETFNAMAFAGMPSDIAEYIQASSRVGRTHVGFSLLVPTPQARRDRFVVGVHESFHRLLERRIAPPAGERWADRAVARTIPSLVQTWLAGVYYQKAFVSAADGAKSAVRFPATVEAVEAIFRGRDGAANFDECLAFITAAIGIDAVSGGSRLSAEYYRELVRRGVDAVRAEIVGGNFTGSLQDFWRNEQNPLRGQRPMLSLRDVDEAGSIFASPLTLKNKPVTNERVAATMALLRNRGIARGRRAASSETDAEETHG